MQKVSMKKRKLSIKIIVVGLLLICWFLPFLIIAGLTGSYMSGNHFENQINSQRKSLSFYNQVCTERLNHAIMISRQATYDGTINRIYRSWKNGELSMEAMLQACNSQLYQMYAHDDCIQDAILWMKEGETLYKANSYNESTGGGYRQIEAFWESDYDRAEEIAADLDTKIQFYNQDGKLYLIRNMVDSNFKKVATLVLRLNQRYCFANLTNQAEDTDVTVWINEQEIPILGKILQWSDVRKEGEEGRSGYYLHQNKLGIYDSRKEDDYRITTMLRIREAAMITPFYGYRILLAGMLICLVPLLILTILLFRKYFSEPVDMLVKGAEEIEKGNLGYQLRAVPGAEEFTYLSEAFNKMSSQLKFQFDHIYEEEIALRDARIMALQSHINPHFMNNTLEIINWEARMNGDEQVSQMIEALSTLMDATIDRRRQPEVRLSEEMRYVNAYLKILKTRLGKRLDVINELPASIMDYQVPRLILQPIIENAIIHGLEGRENGRVMVQARQTGEEILQIQIRDDGVGMSREQVWKLNHCEEDTSEQHRMGEERHSIGYYNVNEIIRLNYGDGYGLYTESEEGAGTCIYMTLPVRKGEKDV